MYENYDGRKAHFSKKNVNDKLRNILFEQNSLEKTLIQLLRLNLENANHLLLHIIITKITMAWKCAIRTT